MLALAWMHIHACQLSVKRSETGRGMQADSDETLHDDSAALLARADI
jgi:hypothetical protein